MEMMKWENRDSYRTKRSRLKFSVYQYGKSGGFVWLYRLYDPVNGESSESRSMYGWRQEIKRWNTLEY